MLSPWVWEPEDDTPPAPSWLREMFRDAADWVSVLAAEEAKS